LGGLLKKSFFSFVILSFVVLSESLLYGKGDSLSLPSSSQGLKDLQEDLFSKSQPWKRIWQVGALLFPEISKERVLTPIESGERPPFTDRELAWWTLASWEVFVSTGNRQVLEKVAPHANILIEETEQRRDPKNKLLKMPLETEKNLEVNLAMAQAWRVLGRMQGILKDRSRALYCENRYQQIRLLLKNRLQNPDLSQEVQAYAQIWQILPNPKNSPYQFNLFARTFDPKDSKAMGPMIHSLRDLFGIRLWPYELAFDAKRPCKGKNEPLFLDSFSYRDAKFSIELKDCGEKVQSLRLDGKKVRRIPGNLEGMHKVEIKLKS